MKYLVRVKYSCETANEIEGTEEGTWLIIETSRELREGVLKPGEWILSPHGCKRHYYSQACENDITCDWQEILKVELYSEERANQLYLEDKIIEIKGK